MLSPAILTLGLVFSRFVPALTQTRGMALEGARGFSEREKTIEDRFFTQEDKRLLEKVLAKVKNHTDVSDASSVAATKSAELSALSAIVEKYKLAQGDKEALLKWKHTTY